jgi:hypothetical protein
VLAEHLEQLEIVVVRWVVAEGHDAPAGAPHADAAGIVPVEDLHPVAVEHARLRGRVLGHPDVAIEVVLAQIQHRRRVGAQARRGLELEARELEHPDLRHAPGLEPGGERVEHRGRDVPGDGGVEPRGPAHRAGERGDRGLAVRAGDRDHAPALRPGRVAR